MIATTASPKSQVRTQSAGVVLMNGRSGVGGSTFVGSFEGIVCVGFMVFEVMVQT